ncbi:YggS family pyridoxal phosphate-dependent enzyme [Flammeovirgaceae bacterium SG7u.111]|nr:YggS family pyridoxal phosphate-dependent enzyme [Flammeovirgaceae bacterium SG7u.132]WPO35187.1 YggS family pyridoxal phosphate-dependent enzyme [Flammeovirgaceae bacterium SG7u.111]
MELVKNLEKINQELSGAGCRLVAVSKTKPVSMLQEAYDAGVRIFGENRVQELVAKNEELPQDIEWHMIGHLQTNKVKQIASFVNMIHSVESFKLLEEINKRAAQHDRVVNCLLQIHIAQEESKFGLDEKGLLEILQNEKLASLENICVKGLMGMATFTQDKEQVRSEFKSLKQLFDRVATLELPSNVDLKEVSMGMSGDYKIAIEEGSTLVRVGSLIFGSRS